MIKSVTILGIGLIGGSIALGFKDRTNVEVVGFDHSQESLNFALKTGMIDHRATSLIEAVQDADVIILALPVGAIKQVILQLSQMKLKESCIITDVGSTKSEIVQLGKKLNQLGFSFIGGHPMAGSHRSGAKAADSLLFENAYYILTPLPETPPDDVQRLSDLLAKATKAQMLTMDAVEHDRIVGAISHLPHIIAAGLVVQVGRYNRDNHWFHRLAAGGFRDLTRIASSHPVMWRDVLLSNREEVMKLLDDWIEQMQLVKESVRKKDAEQLEALFSQAKKLRSQIDEQSRGILTQIYECYVSVHDHPGVIGKIATLLGDHGINLSNIGIMENREEFPGVLRLSFKEKFDYERAIHILSQVGFEVFADIDEKEAAYKS